MLYEPLESLTKAEAAFASAKVAYTTRLTQLVVKYNAKQPITVQDMTDLVVNFYDPMTVASNALRAEIDVVDARKDQLSATGFETSIYDLMYGTHLNIFCGLPSKAAALECIEKMAADYRAEVTSWFDSQVDYIADTSFEGEKAIAGYYNQTPVLSGWPPETTTAP